MKEIIGYWQWDPFTVMCLLMLCLIYLKLWKFRFSKNLLPFLVALALLVICLLSPVHLLSAQYLFSVHMAVHVCLLLIVAPLLVVSLPPKFPDVLDRFSSFVLAHPLLSWFSGVGIMWFWHIPAVFNGMMHPHAATHSLVHGLETFSLIAAGILFSYPVLARERKMHALTGVVYLSSACVFCSLLGLMITFAPVGIYAHYLSPMDPHHLNSLIQNRWGISRADDQQAAGLIMWVPCCMIYVVGSLALLRQWFREKNTHEVLQPFTKNATL